LMQRLGNVSDQEMFRTFNMGIGMIVIASQNKTKPEAWFEIGRVVEGDKLVKVL
jgi:phosphoribosylformylglycinamidine cyclo-ligase